MHYSFLPPDSYLRLFRLGMACHIVQRLLHNPVKIRLDRARQAPLGTASHRHGNSRSLRHSCRQELQSRDKTQIVQDGGTKLVREISQLIFHLVQELPDLLDDGFVIADPRQVVVARKLDIPRGRLLE